METAREAGQPKHTAPLWIALILCFLYASLAPALTPSAQVVFDEATLVEQLSDGDEDSDTDLLQLFPAHLIGTPDQTLPTVAPLFLHARYSASAFPANSPRAPPLSPDLQ